MFAPTDTMLMSVSSGFGTIDESDSESDWDTPDGTGRDNMEQLTDNAVVMLFEEIRQLFKDIPNLDELVFIGGFDEFEELGEATVAEKRHGKPFNVRQMWEDLTPPRVSRRGSGHPSPHSRFTYKGQGLEAFLEFKSNIRCRYKKRAGKILTEPTDASDSAMTLALWSHNCHQLQYSFSLWLRLPLKPRTSAD